MSLVLLLEEKITAQSKEVLDLYRRHQTMICLAESCTGGMVSAAITENSGSSEVFERGFVTYTNQAKIEMLGVLASTLDQYGAVSSQTAAEMAIGALKNSKADVAVSITGIAGPSGGSQEKPVGLVYFGFASQTQKKAQTFEQVFTGNRREIRAQATVYALQLLLDLGIHKDVN